MSSKLQIIKNNNKRHLRVASLLAEGDRQTVLEIQYLLSEHNRLEEDNKKMKEALEFYADQENYLGCTSNLPIFRDNGYRARKFLGEDKITE